MTAIEIVKPELTVRKHPDRYRSASQAARVEHWATRAYHQFLKARANEPFVWGSQDCALFAADGIQAMIGVDIAADFRGKYDDEAGALATIKSVCGGSTVADAAAYCATKHNLPEWSHPLLARRGDLVVLEDPDATDLSGQPRIIAGLVHLSGRHVVAAGELGLKRLPITQVMRSWHV
jgi:hypothetical protein